jgi:hypothetical protein
MLKAGLLRSLKRQSQQDDNDRNPRHGFSISTLNQAALPSESERLNRSTASPGGVAIRHDMNRNIGLLDALNRHSRPNLAQEPLLKFCFRFQGAPADDQRVRVKRIDHLVEEQSEGMRLHSKYLSTHWVSAFGMSSNLLGRASELTGITQFVTGIPAEKEWQESPLDCRQGAQRFQIADAATIAIRD